MILSPQDQRKTLHECGSLSRGKPTKQEITSTSRHDEVPCRYETSPVWWHCPVQVWCPLSSPCLVSTVQSMSGVHCPVHIWCPLSSPYLVSTVQSVSGVHCPVRIWCPLSSPYLVSTVQSVSVNQKKSVSIHVWAFLYPFLLLGFIHLACSL